MATMRRLKSTLKLGSKDHDNDLSNKTSLKRSNAKLRKNDLSSFVFDIPEETPDDFPIPEILPPPKPFRRGYSLRPDATSSSTSVLLQPPALLGIPYDAIEPDFAPTFTRKDSQQSESSSNRRESKTLSKVFSKWHAKRPQPVDNFTKWDEGRPCAHQSLPAHGLDFSATGVDSILASAILGIGSVAAGPSNPNHKRESVESNPYNEAMRARRSWADRRENQVEFADDDDFEEASGARSRQKTKRQAICEIDWSQYNDGEAIRELIQSYDESINFDHNDISPVDSGVGLVADDEPAVGKGKTRAVESVNGQSEPDSVDLDEIVAMKLAFEDSIRAQKRTWREEMQALEAQQEEALERLRRREEERERQEEADRIHAEEMEQAERARIAAELLRPRECVCCGDEKEPSSFPAHPPTYTCEHSSQTCTDCMHAWISSEFTSKGSTDLKCPECPETLSYDDVHRAATHETFLAYEKLLTRTLLGSLPEFSWCLNPAGCDSGQENSANNNYMECIVCKYRQCLHHACAWHVDETCAQYDYRTSGQKSRDEEKATAEILDEVSKKCPGPGCGWRIQKVDGCDHMTCRKCRWEFCWLCLASHREIKRVGNEAHEGWCKFHSRNLETSWPFNAHA
ncbi:hypothetical protein M409DRAFT_53924 [Zasmidium cellare ATCC 36951]|uniref:RING-type domain-containing protein n=1 Tax=Zasmidium cellare ATCC 36951 TaxID=1080233 RepID=A0A6A6CPD7_ZASCE|nr:uncharacterized protein M409DRAFT_53924 [Zasmidium cellare ATCC 36951]KAF2167990.1 hypothetical protein M409DRAFT_53924 [Zasmidium cellare ATCC 36951]